MKYLGIDYGTKRVGTAVSDEEGKIAFPQTVLKNDKNLTAALAALCRERGVSEIVIGDSRKLSGEPNAISPEIEKLKIALAEETKLQTHYEPEFWSSAQAERFQGKTDKLDASAAAIILQSFLDKKHGMDNKYS